MTYVALILLIVSCISIGVLLDILYNLLYDDSRDIKIKMIVDKNNNVYYLKQYFYRNKLIKTETIAKISSQNEISIY